jgi:hypothetical protein
MLGKLYWTCGYHTDTTLTEPVQLCGAVLEPGEPLIVQQTASVTVESAYVSSCCSGSRALSGSILDYRYHSHVYSDLTAVVSDCSLSALLNLDSNRTHLPAQLCFSLAAASVPPCKDTVPHTPG